MSVPMIELDGSFGEGGGQILRTSLTLSLLTGQPFHLRNVRARRPKPGLQAQHLRSVLAAAHIGSAAVNGATLGSCDLVFEPGPVTAGNRRFEIGTAGATGLVLHTVYLPLALRTETPTELTLTGGTHVITSPTFPFLDGTWRRYLELMGIRVSLRLDRAGFYPRGGGLVRAVVQPCPAVKPLTLGERGEVTIRGVSAVAGLDQHIAKRQARRAEHLLKRERLKVEIAEESWEGGPGSVLVLSVETGSVPAVFVGLGARGRPAEQIAADTVEEVIAYLRADNSLVDPHSADQLVLPLALAEGASEYRTTEVTPHLTTNVAVIQRFLDREIVVEGEEGQPGTVRVAAPPAR